MGDQLAEAARSICKDSTSAVELLMPCRGEKLVKNAGYFDKTTFSVQKRKYFHSIYVSLKREMGALKHLNASP